MELGAIEFKLSETTAGSIKILMADVSQLIEKAMRVKARAIADSYINKDKLLFEIVQLAEIAETALKRMESLLVFMTGEKMVAERAMEIRRELKRKGRVGRATLKLPQLIELARLTSILAWVYEKLFITKGEAKSVCDRLFISGLSPTMKDWYEPNVCKSREFKHMLPNLIKELQNLYTAITEELDRKCSCSAQI